MYSHYTVMQEGADVESLYSDAGGSRCRVIIQ